MRFDQIDENTARVEGIPDIQILQDGLAEKGKFNANKGLYTMQVPGGQIIVSLNWWPGALDIKIKEKPFFVPKNAIWAGIKKEIAKS